MKLTKHHLRDSLLIASFITGVIVVQYKVIYVALYEIWGISYLLDVGIFRS